MLRVVVHATYRPPRPVNPDTLSEQRLVEGGPQGPKRTIQRMQKRKAQLLQELVRAVDRPQCNAWRPVPISFSNVDAPGRTVQCWQPVREERDLLPSRDQHCRRHDVVFGGRTLRLGGVGGGPFQAPEAVDCPSCCPQLSRQVVGRHIAHVNIQDERFGCRLAAVFVAVPQAGAIVLGVEASQGRPKSPLHKRAQVVAELQVAKASASPADDALLNSVAQP
mmetsp:Transcript_7385/g.28033  ORF Transcript_7385/g.28033 Transcript_7385/m.28033 type:complete len:221 (+) Transcript_7385:1233-1895(+)|eukprot:scaffold2393_cov267-Pinguiococcus_pyrenoidosus.AAC.14